MHVTSSTASEIYRSNFLNKTEHKIESKGVASTPDSMKSADIQDRPCEDCIRSMIMLILAPVLIPLYTVLSLLSIMLSVAMMFIVAQALLVVLLSLFLIFK